MEVSSFRRSSGEGVFSKNYGDIFVTSVSDTLRPGLRGLLRERAREGGSSFNEDWVNYVLDNDEMHFGMAFCRDVGAGYWMAEKEYGSTLESRYLFVHPDFRGNRIGG